MPSFVTAQRFLLSDIAAKGGYLGFSWQDSLLVSDRAQAHMSAAFYLKMTVKMLDSLYQSFALFHIRSCAQDDSIAFFTCTNACVRVVGVAVRRAAVDESLELLFHSQGGTAAANVAGKRQKLLLLYRSDFLGAACRAGFF